MSVLPLVSGRDVVKALIKVGYEHDRQRGSHIILRQVAYPHRRIVIPDHKEVAKGTLRSIIRETGLTVGEFKDLLQRAMVPRGFGYVAKLLKDDRLVRLVQKGDVTLVDHRFALRSTE